MIIKGKKPETIASISAYLTHEINTPLTYLKGNLELIGNNISSLPPSATREELILSQDKMQDAILEIEKVINAIRTRSVDSSVISSKDLDLD